MGVGAVISLCVAGVMAFVLTNPRLSNQAVGPVHYAYPRWEGVGVLSLGIALLCAWREYGFSDGVLLWLGCTITAGIVSYVVAWFWPRKFVWIVVCSVLLGGVLTFLSDL